MLEELIQALTQVGLVNRIPAHISFGEVVALDFDGGGEQCPPPVAETAKVAEGASDHIDGPLSKELVEKLRTKLLLKND